MRGFMGYLLIGGLATLAMSAVTLTGFGLAFGARPLAEPGVIIQHVDRTHKGDRLDLPTRFGARPSPQAQPALPVGCDRVFSSLSTKHANPAGRCLT
jgi:hypothetical protein